jgi:thermostable 8-oxoguanine DNA glycosylase
MQEAGMAGLIDRYSIRNQETVALEAGKKILEGDYSLKNLRAIVMWKSSRTAGKNLETNEQAVKTALENAVKSIKCERKAIESLLPIKGVGVPVASAIMTTIAPESYTIIDYRALETLKLLGEKFLSPDERFDSKHTKGSIDEYLDYLSYCKRLASRYDVCLRKLDYTLWQYSYEHGLNWTE